MAVICCTLVPQKLYSIIEWYEYISESNFSGQTYVLFNPHASIYENRTDWQMIDDRNKLRDICLNLNQDMWLVDSDTIPPLDAFEKLNSVDADIVSGIVRNPTQWNVYSRNDTRNGIPAQLYEVDPNSGVIQRPDLLVQFGCCLLRKSVIEKVKFTNTYRNVVYSKPHDLIYCLEALDKGFRVACHTDVVCKHIRMNKNEWIDKPKYTYTRN